VVVGSGFNNNLCISPNFLSDTDTQFIKSLSVAKLKVMRKWVGQLVEQRITRKKFKKYGNTNKGFTDEELEKFFKYSRNEEFKEQLAFSMQAYLGLRIGEVVQVKISDIDLEKRTIRIDTEKSKTCDSLHLHDRIYNLLKSHIAKHEKAIQAHNGYLLYSDAPNFNRENLSEHYLRKKFREICNRAGLNEWYGYADEQSSSRVFPSGRKLHRLTTHSLRHYFGTKVYESTKDPILTSKLMRHSELRSTQIYIHTNKDKMQKGIEEAFEIKSGN